MLTGKQIKIIKCSDFNPDDYCYCIQMFPIYDIVYFDDNTTYNPILETDWMEIDADDITNEYVHIPNDPNQPSIRRLLDIMNRTERLIYNLNHKIGTVLCHPTIITDRMKQRKKLKIPFIKPLSEMKPSIELSKL